MVKTERRFAMKEKAKNIARRIGYFAIPVIQSMVISVGVYYVIRGIDSLFQSGKRSIEDSLRR
jgi:hypothetical protein